MTVNSSFERQKRFQPNTDRNSIYKPSNGWIGGHIDFPDSSAWNGGRVDARLEIAGSSLRGFVNLKVSETWVTPKGRHMERVISMDIDPENVKAIHAALGKVIRAHEGAS